MKKKGALLAAGIAVFLCLSGVSYTAAGSVRVERQTWTYLEDRGYTRREIQSLKVSHSFLNRVLGYPEWTAEAVYADEPTSDYHYYLKDGAMVDGGVSGTTEKENLTH
jgi:hypothetical protein